MTSISKIKINRLYDRPFFLIMETLNMAKDGLFAFGNLSCLFRGKFEYKQNSSKDKSGNLTHSNDKFKENMISLLLSLTFDDNCTPYTTFWYRVL